MSRSAYRQVVAGFSTPKVAGSAAAMRVRALVATSCLDGIKLPAQINIPDPEYLYRDILSWNIEL